jgi:hypothetical protein
VIGFEKVGSAVATFILFVPVWWHVMFGWTALSSASLTVSYVLHFSHKRGEISPALIPQTQISLFLLLVSPRARYLHRHSSLGLLYHTGDFFISNTSHLNAGLYAKCAPYVCHFNKIGMYPRISVKIIKIKFYACLSLRVYAEKKTYMARLIGFSKMIFSRV